MVGVRGSGNAVAMTYARSQIAPPGEYGCFHVVTRCVRRAFLCGSDQLTGRSFDHRRQWVEERIHFLGDSFAVSIYSYAVAQATQLVRFCGEKKCLRSAVKRVSNHTHIVLSVDPQAVSYWTDEQVADRWLRVFSGAMAQASSNEQRPDCGCPALSVIPLPCFLIPNSRASQHLLRGQVIGSVRTDYFRKVATWEHFSIDCTYHSEINLAEIN